MAPRPFVAALAALLTFSLALLLFSHQQTSVSSFSYPGFFGSASSPRSLSVWVLDEDARYDFVLQDRQQLINKWTTAFDSCVYPIIPYPYHSSVAHVCAHIPPL